MIRREVIAIYRVCQSLKLNNASYIEGLRVYVSRASGLLISFGLLMTASFSSVAVDYPWQINAGGLYSKGYDDTLNAASQWKMLPFSLKYRAPSWSVQLAGSYLLADNINELDQSSYSGFGDTQFKVSYLLPKPLFNSWWVDINTKIKIPTADNHSGVGTGEVDYWFDVDALRMFSQRYFVQLNGGKKLRGKSAELELLDSFYISSSLGAQLSELSGMGMVVEYMESASDWSEEVIELMFYGSYRLNAQNTVLLYVIKGFTGSSIDYGAGLQLSYRFGHKATVN